MAGWLRESRAVWLVHNSKMNEISRMQPYYAPPCADTGCAPPAPGARRVRCDPTADMAGGERAPFFQAGRTNSEPGRHPCPRHDLTGRPPDGGTRTNVIAVTARPWTGGVRARVRVIGSAAAGRLLAATVERDQTGGDGGQRQAGGVSRRRFAYLAGPDVLRSGKAPGSMEIGGAQGGLPTMARASTQRLGTSRLRRQGIGAAGMCISPGCR